MAVEPIDPRVFLDLETDTTVAPPSRRRINWPLAVGAALLLLIGGACVAAPLLTSYDPNAQDLLNPSLPPFSPNHLLGTDAPYGRDMLSRLLYGGRADLLLGIVGTGVSIIVGSLIGLISGYFGRWIDSVVMRVVDVFIAFPYLVLVLVIVAFL